MGIAGLIGVVIAIVVGASLIPVITDMTKTVTNDPNTPASISALANFLPIVFAVMIILGVVTQVSSHGGLPLPSFGRNPNKRLIKQYIEQLEEISNNFSEYVRNLDNYLGIKTIAETGLNENAVVNVKGLLLTEKNELFRDNRYHWYIVDKDQELPKFKIIGLHKKDPTQYYLYVLGKDDQDKVYLYSIDNELMTNILDSLKNKNSESLAPVGG